MSHTVDALEYALKANRKEPVNIRLRSIYPPDVNELGTCVQKCDRVRNEQVTCAREMLYQAMNELAETYALFPILWRYQGSDEVHEVNVNIKSHVIPWPASDKYNIGPGFLGEADPVKEEVIAFPPQLVRQTMKRYRRLMLESQQMRFDRSVDRLRRAGLIRLANRAIIVDLVKGWPRRNGII